MAFGGGNVNKNLYQISIKNQNQIVQAFNKIQIQKHTITVLWCHNINVKGTWIKGHPTENL